MSESLPTGVPSGTTLPAAEPEPASRPAGSAVSRLLTRIALDRPLLLIALIGALVIIMGILRPTTFLSFDNAAVVL